MARSAHKGVKNMADYSKDTLVVTILWGRVGSAILGLVAFVLGLCGYALAPEDLDRIEPLIGSILAGLAGVLAIASKLRESRKVKDNGTRMG